MFFLSPSFTLNPELEKGRNTETLLSLDPMSNFLCKLLNILFYTLFLPLTLFEYISWSGIPGRSLKLFVKRGKLKAHIAFCLECKRLRLIPKGFFTKISIYTANAARLERQFARRRMLEEIRHAHFKLSNLNAEIHRSVLDMAWDKDEIKTLERRQSHVYHLMLKKKKEKLKKLLKPPTRTKLDAVKNDSNRSLSEDELFVLSLGPKFQPVPRKIPIMEIIAATERSISKPDIGASTAADIKKGVINALQTLKFKAEQKQKILVPNLT